MHWPTSQDYNQAIQNPAVTLGDAELKGGQPTVNALGLPLPRSGNFADVYPFQAADGRMWAIKCFTRPVVGLQERYARIDEHLSALKLKFTVGFQFLPEGIRIRGAWFPIVKMEWVEGLTLNEFLRENAEKPHYLHALLQMWGKLTTRLREAQVAHADLQHGNVLLVPGSSPSKLGLKLIDYDGMWVPALAKIHSGEIGHPNFQHPSRLKNRLYDADVDRFPHLVIAAALRATLIGGKRIWDAFDNGDNLLFREADLADPGKAVVFKTLWQLEDPMLRSLVGRLALATTHGLSRTPWLDAILFDEKWSRLKPSEERQVIRLLGMERPVIAEAAPAPAVPMPAVAEEFQFFRQNEEDDEPVHAPMQATRAEPPRLALFAAAGFCAIALIAATIAIFIERKKPNLAPGPVAQNSDEVGGTGEQPIPPGDTNPEPKATIPGVGKELPPVVSKNEPLSPFNALKHPHAVIGVTSMGEGLLFIAEQEPWLYRLPSSTSSKAKRLARHDGTMRILTGSSDGNVVLTGSDDGTIQLWRTPETANRHPYGERIVASASIDGFVGKYGYTIYRAGIVVQDDTSARQVAIPAGTGPCPVASIFKEDLLDADNAEKLGQALTEGIDLFDEALTLQLFQGGVLIHEAISSKTRLVFHLPRKAIVLGQETANPGTVELQDPKVVAKWTEHTGAIRALAISADQLRAVSLGEDNLLCVWNLPKGGLIRKFKVPPAGAVAWLADGKRILLGTDGQSAAVWNLETEEREWELPGHTGRVRCVAVAESSHQGFTAGDDGSIRLWNLDTGAAITKLEKSKAATIALSLRVDGKFLIAVDAEDRAWAWEIGTANVTELPVPAKSIRSLAFNRDGSSIFWTAGKAGEAGLVGTSSSPLPAIKQNSAQSRDPVTLKSTTKQSFPTLPRLAWSPDGKRLLVVRATEVGVVETANGTETQKLALSAPVRALAFGAENRLYLATHDGKLQTWDLVTGQLLRDIDTEETGLGTIYGIHVLPGQRGLLLTTHSPNLVLWNPVKNLVEKRLAPYPKQTCKAISLHPDGIHGLLVYPSKNQLRLWNFVNNGPTLEYEQVPLSNLEIVGFSPDGKWLVGYEQQERGAIFLWDATTGKRLQTLRPIETSILSADFTTGGHALAIWELDGTHFTIDLKSSQVSKRFSSLTPARRLSFSPNSNAVAVLDASGQLRIESLAVDAVAPAMPSPILPQATGSWAKISEILPDEIVGSSFSSDGTAIYAATRNGSLFHFNPDTFDVAATYPISNDPLRQMARLPRHSVGGVVITDRLYFLDSARRLQIWDTETHTRKKTVTVDKLLPVANESYLFAVLPDASYALFTEKTGTKPHGWNLQTGKEAMPPGLARLPFAKGLRTVAFSDDGKVATAFAQPKLLVWNLVTGRDYSLLDAKNLVLENLALMPETTLVIGVEANHLHAWSYTTGKKIWSVDTPANAGIIAIATIPKSKSVLGICRDDTLRIWDAQGLETAKWSFDTKALAIAVAQNGKCAVTIHGPPHQLRLWAMPLAQEAN